MSSTDLKKQKNCKKPTNVKKRKRNQKEINKSKDNQVKLSNKKRKSESKKKLMKESRKRTKDQLAILESFYEKDPNWTRKTFLEAASALKIKPIQAYKWGYHKKMKENEGQSEDKQAETKEISQESCWKDCGDDQNYNELVGEIIEKLSEVNEVNYFSDAHDSNNYSEGVMNDYNNIQSAIDQSSEINHPDNLDHQYEEDLDCKFQEFNCISLREEERILFKNEENDESIFQIDSYM